MTIESGDFTQGHYSDGPDDDVMMRNGSCKAQTHLSNLALSCMIARAMQTQQRTVTAGHRDMGSWKTDRARATSAKSASHTSTRGVIDKIL